MDRSIIPIVCQFLRGVRLEEIMSAKVITVDLYAPFSQVEELMRFHDIRHLPVIFDNGNLAGLVTQRDLYRIAPPQISEDGTRFYLKEYLDRYILKHVMTKDPFSLKPEASLADALIAMAHHRYGCIPIVDVQGKLCGMVTQTDIVRRTAKLLTE